MPLKRTNLIIRSRVLQAIRDFFASRNFLEVETPYLIPANAPEEHIDPCQVSDWYLHTSPEMCMKRLLCDGFERIFQICRCWRYGERGSRHVPEFTMLEWYRSGCDYNDLMSDCEDLLLHIMAALNSGGPIEFAGCATALNKGFHRVTVQQAFERYCPINMEEALISGDFDELMATRIEPALHLDKPVILMDYPIEMAALARPKNDDPRYAERFELYAGGMELANGFSELNDPGEQRRRFMAANNFRQATGRAELPMPEPFLRDLASMPPSAGIALGIDRLVMLLSGATTIDEVLAFTPENL